MGDIASTRPASGAPIATAWGAELHDAIEGIQTGTVTINLSGASTATAAVTFPRPYATPPRVFLSVQQTFSSAATSAFCGGSGITTTGFTAQGGRDDGTNATGAMTVSWLAIGTPA
jgi:hypothetical protein